MSTFALNEYDKQKYHQITINEALSCGGGVSMNEYPLTNEAPKTAPKNSSQNALVKKIDGFPLADAIKNGAAEFKGKFYEIENIMFCPTDKTIIIRVNSKKEVQV